MNPPADENEPQAFEEHAPDQSVVQADRPFRAEVAKRKNTRQLIGGLILVLGLIVILAIGSFMLKQYRVKYAENKATKEKAAREKMEMGRKGRDFNADERPPLEESAGETKAPAAVPTQAAMHAPGGPLPAGFATPPNGTPLPTSSPQAAAPISQPAATPKPAAVPSMMLGGPPDQATAEAKAASMIAAQQPAERQSVQDLASQKAKGQAPTSTAQASAAALGDRSFVLARGSWIPCVLETQLNTTVPGDTTCVVPENVYSDDGKALLIEKGSRANGAFGNTLKAGDERIAVQWSRIKTTRGIVIDVDSPTADGIGTTGAGGTVNNHWPERIGAAVLLSFIEDGMAYAIAQEQNKSGLGNNTSVYVPTNTVGSTRRMSERVLDSTINIPPTLYKNRGDRIMIFVNRDLWFDSTYKLVKAP